MHLELVFNFYWALLNSIAMKHLDMILYHFVFYCVIFIVHILLIAHSIGRFTKGLKYF